MVSSDIMNMTDQASLAAMKTPSNPKYMLCCRRETMKECIGYFR